MNAKASIAVAAGILRDDLGQVLVARRPEGTDQAGWWEFPGGQILPEETPLEGLVRELQEELGVTVRSASPLLTYEHEYPEKVVKLHVWQITDYVGQPSGVEGQPLRWLPVADLLDEGLLPADRPIVDRLLQS